MTLLAVSVAGSSIEKIRADIYAAVDAGADLVELRLDLMEEIGDEDIRSLREQNPVSTPLLLTIRSREEGGGHAGSGAERVERLIGLAPIGEYVDVESTTWQQAPELQESIRAAFGEMEGASGAMVGKMAERSAPRLILSRHDTVSRPAKLQVDLLTMLNTPECEVAKLAWRARSVRDNFEAFELMRSSPKPVIVICMGEAGVPSRLLAKKFGAFATFASVRRGAETAEGQVSVGDLKQIYRWDAIGTDTATYGVVGHPLGHSLSPRVHNDAFTQAGDNAVYVRWQVNPGYDSFKAFMVEMLARPWLDVRGLSITLPHKENALRFVEEVGGALDPAAARIGAVNTLTISPEGAVAGMNTDGPAAMDALSASLDGRVGGQQQATSTAKGPHFAGDVAVLGAGGAARAIVAGLAEAGAKVTIFARTPDSAAVLAGRFGCAWRPWEERTSVRAEVVVNCTPVGLWPAVDQTPLPAEAMQGGMTIFDTIYNPRPTRLLREAAERGCRTIDGLEMFVRQAAAQRACWGLAPVPMEMLFQAAERGMADQG